MHVWYIVFVTLVGGSSMAINRQLAVAFMLQMKRFMRSGCLYIHVDFQTDISEEKEAARLVKEVSLAGSMLATLEIGRFPIVVQRLGCQNNQPLQVFLKSDQQAISILQRLSPSNLLDSKWLIFASHKIAPNLYNPLPLGLNCYFFIAYPNNEATSQTTIHVDEIFRVGWEAPVQDHRVIIWQSDKRQLQFMVNPNELWRRGDLFGYTMKSLVDENQYYTELYISDDKSEIILKGGYYGLIWKILEENMNFRTNFTFSDSHWLYNETTVKETLSDAALHVLRFNRERTALAKYTTPLKSMKYYVFIRKPSIRSFRWNNFLVPFSSQLWLCCFGTLLLITITAVIVIRLDFRRPACHYLTNTHERELSSSGEVAVAVAVERPPPVYEVFFSMLGAFTSQAYDLDNKRYLLRAIYLIAYLNNVILIAAYSANFISGLAIKQIRLPFQNLEELVNDGSYDFGLLNISRNIIDRNSDRLSYRLWNLMNRDNRNLPSTISQAYHEICKRNYAFMTPKYNMAPLESTGPCELTTLPSREILISAMMLPTTTPYQKLFNFRLNRMRETGIFHRLHKQIFPIRGDHDDDNFEAVDFINMLPILCILFFGCIIASVFVFLEKIYSKMLRRKNKIYGIMMSGKQNEKELDNNECTINSELFHTSNKPHEKTNENNTESLNSDE